ncbi:MAG: hypothetical protein ACK5IQ_11435 [Bacteroidales bacterium]
MSKQLIFNIVLGALMLISVVLVFMIFKNIEGLESANRAEHQGVVLNAINWSIFLLVVGALAAVVVGVIQIIGNPKQLIGVVAIFAVVAIVVFICYSMADSTITETPSIKQMIDSNSLTPDLIKVSGAIVYVATAALGISIVSLLFAGVRNAVN